MYLIVKIHFLKLLESNLDVFTEILFALGNICLITNSAIVADGIIHPLRYLISTSLVYPLSTP
jgi:hypothetical protein